MNYLGSMCEIKHDGVENLFACLISPRTRFEIGFMVIPTVSIAPVEEDVFISKFTFMVPTLKIHLFKEPFKWNCCRLAVVKSLSNGLPS